jgi:hypothetical protein
VQFPASISADPREDADSVGPSDGSAAKSSHHGVAASNNGHNVAKRDEADGRKAKEEEKQDGQHSRPVDQGHGIHKDDLHEALSTIEIDEASSLLDRFAAKLVEVVKCPPSASSSQTLLTELPYLICFVNGSTFRLLQYRSNN